MKTNEKSNLSNIKKAAEIIKKGGIVIFPTDTVYGIGCRFDNSESAEKITKIKNRPKNLPFPVLVANKNQLENYATITPLAQNLIEKYWPGALTIVLKSKDGNVTGFRMPNSKLVLDLISLSGIPIIGTSANFHGKNTAANFEQLDPDLIKLADYVLKGDCSGGKESTVVDATGKGIKIIRQGAINL